MTKFTTDTYEIIRRIINWYTKYVLKLHKRLNKDINWDIMGI